MTHLTPRILAAALLLAPLSAAAAECSAQSGDRRVPLLELYTSEGCDSCPPADRWLSELPGRGFTVNHVVVLAFHVDYWDRLGWVDRFGRAAFSERQRVANHRNNARFVYTPQLMLNGRDYRRSTFGDDLGKQLAELSTPAKATLKVNATSTPDHAAVKISTHAPDGAQTWIAIYENRLATEVRAGENRGKHLRHDFVVRELAGPLPTGDATHRFAVDPGWNKANLEIAAFVTHARTGETLQALALPLCR